MSPAAEIEPLDEFRERARRFATDHLGPVSTHAVQTLRALHTDEEELALVERDRELQRRYFDADLAGIVVPTEYGGQGLTPAHQQVLNEEIHGKEFPSRLQVPTFTPCMAVLLEFASEEVKREHIPAILKGDELWMQFLSDPSGGSDVAGALTTAVRDGEEWILNGSKVWTTGAWWSDWGLCLARTNWDVPKHRGLSVFIFPIDSDGIEVQRIEMLNGNMDFCQEYLDDLRVPDAHRIGEVDDGWTVGSRWMIHERMQSNSPFVTRPTGQEVGRVDGDVTAKLHRGDQVELKGDLVVEAPRVAGPIVQGMDLRSARWRLTPALTLGSGASTDIDASSFAVDLEWLRLHGEPASGEGRVAMRYDVDVAALAELAPVSVVATGAVQVSGAITHGAEAQADRTPLLLASAGASGSGSWVPSRRDNFIGRI